MPDKTQSLRETLSRLDLFVHAPNAAVEQCPKGICLELLVLPAAERRGNQEFTAQLPHSPRSEAKGGTLNSAAARTVIAGIEFCKGKIVTKNDLASCGRLQ